MDTSKLKKCIEELINSRIDYSIAVGKALPTISVRLPNVMGSQDYLVYIVTIHCLFAIGRLSPMSRIMSEAIDELPYLKSRVRVQPATCSIYAIYSPSSGVVQQATASMCKGSVFLSSITEVCKFFKGYGVNLDAFVKAISALEHSPDIVLNTEANMSKLSTNKEEFQPTISHKEWEKMAKLVFTYEDGITYTAKGVLDVTVGQEKYAGKVYIDYTYKVTDGEGNVSTDKMRRVVTHHFRKVELVSRSGEKTLVLDMGYVEPKPAQRKHSRTKEEWMDILAEQQAKKMREQLIAEKQQELDALQKQLNTLAKQ